MPRTSKLKVFRMPVGFHDAYIAAPSQRVAAEAWGADPSVFSRGEAEVVTDAALIAEPLANPGKVIKRLRGTAAEQIAALPTDEAKAKPRKPAPAAQPKPKPSRMALEKAEAALSAAEERHRKEEARLAAREAKLADERHALETRHEEERDALEADRTAAEAAYDDALRQWRAE